MITQLALLFAVLACEAKPLDPDVHKQMAQIVESKGFACDVFQVQTDDGYLLGTFRIRNNNTTPNKPAVLFMHALLASSWDFVNNFRNESLPFLLADAGYDVWFANNRGNTYSLNHTTLKPDSREFWDFSYDEMAKYDLPATVDFVLEQTKKPSLTYIGHSEGTIQAFAAFSTNQRIAKKINLFVALAPVAFVSHQQSPVFSILADLDIAEW